MIYNDNYCNTLGATVLTYYTVHGLVLKKQVGRQGVANNMETG